MPAVRCPSCRKKVRVPDHLAGRKVTCPRCDEVLVVPVELPESVEETTVPPEEETPQEEPLPTSARAGIVALALGCVSVMIMCVPIVGYISIVLSAAGLPLGLWGLHRSRMDGTQTLSRTLTGAAPTEGGLGSFGTRAQHYPLAGVGACLIALVLALLPILFG
jgi:hypothetical protein